MGKRKKQSKNRTFRNVLLLILLVGLIYGGIQGFTYYVNMWKPNISVPEGQQKFLLIYENDDFDDVVKSLEESGVVINIKSFIRAAKKEGYPDKIVSGRYQLEDNMRNAVLLSRLMKGRQTPIRITFNNIRTKEALAHRLSSYLRMRDADMLNVLSDETLLSQYGLNPETAVSLFIPNTYEVYWDISPEDLLRKMKEEYDRFWTEDRLSKLNDVGLTQVEVSVLASIVEEETNKKDEKPRIAGLYLNRLHKGMLLQADPTVKFALQDFSLQHIYSGQYTYDSPYNTYKYAGLPPGPIRIPSIESIDAVLNFEPHNYIYMCAKEDLSGYHNFAATYEEHLVNKAKYKKELRRRGIIP